jgi:SAM-dependent methyltransferase
MPPSLLREAPWYEHAFDLKYLRVYPHRNEAEAEAAAAHLVAWLGVRPGNRVLDVACGEGRYARALARRGLRVTGVDLSRHLVTEGRERSKLLPGAPVFVRLDARHLPYRNQFEGAISMFTSFGYFDSRDDDLAIFRGIARALVPGGRLVVDFLNEREVRASLVADEVRDAGTLLIEVERWIEESAPGGPRVEKRVIGRTRSTGVEEFEFTESVRLYTGAEVDGLLEEAGFTLVGDPAGDLDRSAFAAGSPRYLRVAELPAS